MRSSSASACGEQHGIGAARRQRRDGGRPAVSRLPPALGRRTAQRAGRTAGRARRGRSGRRPSPRRASSGSASVGSAVRSASCAEPGEVTARQVGASRRSPSRLGDRGEPGRGVHEGRVDAVHRPVEGQGGRGAAGALVGAGQPVAQLLALRLLAAAAHQGGGQQRLGLAVHLQADPGHAAEQPGLDAEQRVVEQRFGVPDQLLPVLDQIGAAGVQEADLGIGVDRRAARPAPGPARRRGGRPASARRARAAGRGGSPAPAAPTSPASTRS